MSGKRMRGSPTFSAVCQEQSRMPLRKRTNKDSAGVSGKSRQEVDETQEDNSPDDKDEASNPAATRQIRRKDRENKLKSKEMTEEEMMDLALRLSEHEANVTARRLQEEEEAVRRAIQDSMLGESKTQSLISDAPLCVSSRRKLIYSNGESQADSERLTTDTSSTRERSRGLVKTSGIDLKRTKKRKRGEGSPLMEMPDLSQSQPSPSSSETGPLGSPQSCDSTQIEHCVLLKSPVFPSSCSAALRASVLIPRLDQDLLDSCSTSGFVLCSQDSRLLSPQKQTRSPTFPKSPAPRSNNYRATHSQTETSDSGDGTQPNLRKSPVLGQKDSSCALKSEAGEGAALVFSSQESSTSFDSEGAVSLLRSPVFAMTERGRGGAERSLCESPVFGTNGRTAKTPGEDKPEDDAEEQHDTSHLSEQELTADMTLHWSDDEDDDVTPVASPSPVFPEERPVLQTNNEIQNQESASAHCSVNPAESQSRAGSEVPGSSGDSGAQSTVHYYWGVPFCPRGLDPDAYTKVIVAQMEVYEKSLKQAQRALLKKLEWGEPILPQPEKSPSPESDSPRNYLTTRRSRRRRGKVKEPESDEERVEVDEETQREQREGREEEEEGREEEAGGPEQEQRDQTQVDSDWEVCPETQLSDNDSTQDLTLPSQPPDKSPEIETVQVDSPAADEPQRPEPEEEMEVDPESQEESAQDSAEPSQSKPVGVASGGPSCESQSRQEPGLRRSESPELDPVSVPGRQSSVQCPICLRAFPSEEIEMHAAFCDGEPAAVDRASPKLRRKRTRRGEAEETNHTADPEPGVTQEKCYLCHRAVPLKDYSRHTERCLQRRVSRTATTGGLLSALDQSDRRDSEAGPSGSTVRPHEVIDLRDDDDDEEDEPLIRISNSPIRSFTAISEAQDCLIDFRKPHRAKKHVSKRR